MNTHITCVRRMSRQLGSLTTSLLRVSLAVLPVQYGNMSFGAYIQRNVLDPGNLTDTFYWNGAPGTQPGGLRHQVLPIPGYTAAFSGDHQPFSMLTVTTLNGLLSTLCRGQQEPLCWQCIYVQQSISTINNPVPS